MILSIGKDMKQMKLSLTACTYMLSHVWLHALGLPCV